MEQEDHFCFFQGFQAKRQHAGLNRELQLIGLLRVMFDSRMTLQQQVSDQLESHFGDKVFRTIIPRNVRLAEAPSYGLPAMLHDKESRGALAYLALAGEMIRRSEQPAPAPAENVTAA